MSLAARDPISRVVCDRAIVLGDIHGCADLLEQMLGRVEPGRQVIVVGDLCDRGPDTRRVMDLLLGRAALGALGNHDLVFRNYLVGIDDPAWLAPHMGGSATIASYAGEPVPSAHRDFLERLAVVVDLEVAGEPFFVIHAGLPTHVPVLGVPLTELVPLLAREHAHELLWGRHDPEASLPVGRPVISGHLKRPRPLMTPDAIAIDTGCGVGGPLTALLLPERRFMHVE